MHPELYTTTFPSNCSHIGYRVGTQILSSPAGSNQWALLWIHIDIFKRNLLWKM